MQFLSDEYVEYIIENLTEGNFEKINKIDLEDSLKEGKIKYEFIVSYIRDIGEEKRSRLHSNAKKIIKDCKEVDDKIIKIINYILLEIPRAVEFDKLIAQSNTSQKLLRELRLELRDNKESMKNSQEKIEKMQSDFISILSIFSAVVISFFGGLSVLGSSLENINKVSHYRLGFVIVIIGVTIFNIIYMLLYVISKLTEKKIGMSVREDICQGCERETRIHCFITKYPIPFFYNLFSIISIITIYALYNIDKYNFIEYISKKIYFIPDDKAVIPVTGGIILFIAYFIIGLILTTYIKRHNCHNKLKKDSKNTKLRLINLKKVEAETKEQNYSEKNNYEKPEQNNLDTYKENLIKSYKDKIKEKDKLKVKLKVAEINIERFKNSLAHETDTSKICELKRRLQINLDRERNLNSLINNLNIEQKKI